MAPLRSLALIAALLSFAAMAQDKPAASAGSTTLTGKFGFVNTERILRDAIPAQRAQKKIEAEFQKRDQELARVADQLKRMQDDIEKNSVTMTESQRRTKEREFGELNRGFQRKQREFREDPEPSAATRSSRRWWKRPTASSARSPSRRSTTSSSRTPSSRARASTSRQGDQGPRGGQAAGEVIACRGR